MFRTNTVGFHTKGYLFHNGDDIRIIVGSSNLTQNAITKNFEWNTKVVATADGQYAKDIENEFNGVWESSIDYREYRDEYAKHFRESKAQKAALNKIVSTLDLSYSRVVEPNAMQREFMSEIMRLIRSGQRRALLVSATGTGNNSSNTIEFREKLSSRLLPLMSFLSSFWMSAIAQAQRVIRKSLTISLLNSCLVCRPLLTGLTVSMFIDFSTIISHAKSDFRPLWKMTCCVRFTISESKI